MHKLFYILTASVILISCIKKEEDPQVVSEKEYQEYLRNQKITVSPTASGLYYIETLAGTGSYPDATGVYIMVNITGTLLNGSIIETNDSIKAYNKGIVSLTSMQHPLKCPVDFFGFPGITEGLKLMKEGGKARLVMPYQLGLGIYGTKTIQFFSNLVYDIELVKVIPNPVLHDSLLVKAITDSIPPADSSISDTVYFLSATPGSGDSLVNGDSAYIRYTRRTVDGFVTDKSGSTETLVVISSPLSLGPLATTGLLAGLKKMKPGGKASMLIKYKHGYGTDGLYGLPGDYYKQQIIPPTTSYIMDVELVSIRKAKSY